MLLGSSRIIPNERDDAGIAAAILEICAGVCRDLLDEIAKRLSVLARELHFDC